MNNLIFISDATVRALGWTLAHSLWQGALVALVLLVLLSRLQTARQRYRAAYTSLVMMLVAAAGTFWWTFEPMADAPAVQDWAVGDMPAVAQFFTENQLLATSVWERATDWLETNYPLIVAVWLLGFGFFLLRLGTGLWQVHRLSKRGIFPVESFWQEKTTALGTRLGMSRAVHLFESALVHTPVALGWFKPVILLPLGLINRLSPAEVEAILAHELAHIARRDWIFNLLQAFIESLFYYHPAVWWMSQVIRNERENCCDDAALAATGNPLAFAKALVQVQEMAAPVPVPALALGMSGSRRFLLLERVRRILNQPQQKSQIMEKLTATAILLALLAFVGIRANNAPTLSAAFAQMTELPTVFFGGQNDENQVVNDSLPKPKSTRKIIREDDDQRVEAEYQDGNLTRLNIDGKEIPEEEYEQYRALTNDLQREIRVPLAPMPPMPPGVYWLSPGTPAVAPIPPVPPVPPVPSRLFNMKDADGNTIIRFEREGDPVEIQIKDGQVWVDGEQLEEGESLELPGGETGFYYWNGDDSNTFHFTPETGFQLKGLEGLEGLRYLENLADFPHFQLSEEDRDRLHEEAARMRDEAVQMNEEYRRMAKEHARMSKEEMRRLEKEMKEQQKEWEKEEKRWAKEQEKWAREQAKWAVEQDRWAQEHRQSNNFGKEMKAELLRDGLISDPTNFRFELSNKELKINGQKQPEEIHRKYLDFYRDKTGKDFGKTGNFNWTESN